MSNSTDATGRDIKPGDRVVYFKTRSGSIYSAIRTVFEVGDFGVRLCHQGDWEHVPGKPMARTEDTSKGSSQWAQGHKMVVIS